MIKHKIKNFVIISLFFILILDNFFLDDKLNADTNNCVCEILKKQNTILEKIERTVRLLKNEH